LGGGRFHLSTVRASRHNQAIVLRRGTTRSGAFQRSPSPMSLRRLKVAALLSVVAYAPAARRAHAQSTAAPSIPSKLSDSAFWKLVTDYSETNGYFRSDNFVSNEDTYQWVIPDLLRTTKPSGAYLGVGPDQNFTYIVALKPKIAFIFDIRRQNMLTHLMYKALLEQSSDRADFASRLFSRKRPAGLDSTSTAQAIFAAFQAEPPDSTAYRRNLASIFNRLIKTHGFKLSDDDTSTITYVYRSFVAYGPDINYNSNMRTGYGRGRMPSWAELQVETDSAGRSRSYMATEANFRALKELEANNLIVPLVGDFAGPKAIRSVGEYLKDRKATVTAFYLSNVEQYLFQSDDDWKKFYTNVGTLPLDSASTFIRSVFNGMGYNRSGQFNSYLRSQQMLASMLEQVTLFNGGQLTSYYQVIQTSR
jgi:hypothetical protein